MGEATQIVAHLLTPATHHKRRRQVLHILMIRMLKLLCCQILLQVNPLRVSCVLFKHKWLWVWYVQPEKPKLMMCFSPCSVFARWPVLNISIGPLCQVVKSKSHRHLKKKTYLTILCVYLKWFRLCSFDPSSPFPPPPLLQSPSSSPAAPWHFLPSLSSTFLPRQRANQHTISLLTGKPHYQAIDVRSEYKPVQNMVNILPTTTSLEVCM